VISRRSLLVGGAAAGVVAGLGTGLTAAAAPDETSGLALRPRLVAAASDRGWRAPPRWDWRRFREVPVSNLDNKVRLTTTGDIGTATGIGGASENDRRFYVLRDVAATDAEISAEFDTTDLAQCGFALRVQPDRAVVVWHNIYFAATGFLIQGVWEYDGSSLHSTNLQARFAPTFVHPVRYAVGDGSSVTVTTAYAHRLVPGDVVLHEGVVHEFGQVMVGATPSPSTYSFASPLTGLWESGTWRQVTVQTRRRAAVRLLGTQVLFKQWRPQEPEPSWDDPDRTVINVLPETLPSGASTPLGPGGVGLLISHLGDGRRVDVRDLRVTPLA
jgi:hypothetical protein